MARQPTGGGLIRIKPKTHNQKRFFDAYDRGDEIIVLHGVAGSGKSFCALYKALESIQNNEYHSIVIIRSAVPTRDVGFLPGNLSEKQEVYEYPFEDIFEELSGDYNYYQKLKERGKIQFGLTSFLRGMTFSNCIVILDEFQSNNLHELETVITRLGEHSRLILLGDIRQNDLLRRNNDVSGLPKFMNILKRMNTTMIEMNIDDIVRGKLVKSYIIASLEEEVYGKNN